MIRRRPGVAYIDTHLWVPKTTDPQILDRLKQIYTYLSPDWEDGPTTYKLWRDAPHHIVVPRTAEVPGIQPVDLRPPTPSVDFQSRITLDSKGSGNLQTSAVREWLLSPGGVLNLACGKGKTVCALEAIARLGRPALVIVHTSLLFNQWIERLKEFLPSVAVGEIRGAVGTWSYKNKGVVVAMLQTLYDHQFEITPELRCRFGIVVVDEVHRLPSKKYAAVADIFPGLRYGLTATDERSDGRHIITQQHLGSIFYTDLKQITPRVYFQVVEFPVNPKDPEVSPYVRDSKGQINLGRLRTYVGRLPARNYWIAEYIKWLASLGRRMIVLTHCRDQVYLLQQMLKEMGIVAGACTGGTGEIEQRLEIVAKNDIIIGTTQIAGEGLDKMSLDTLVSLSPVGRDVSGKNNIQQTIGRILRPIAGKDPVAIFLHDVMVRRYHRMALEMSRILENWPEDQGGKMLVTYIQFKERPPL